MIVVDLGCFAHGPYDSITALQRKFRPDILYGFDPLASDEVRRIGKTVVVTRQLAAWVSNGLVPFKFAGTGSHVGIGKDVACFNLCAWLNTLPAEIVLKMDVEGAEFPLAKALRRTRTDRRLKLLLVELHGDSLWPELRCPVEKWWM